MGIYLALRSFLWVACQPLFHLSVVLFFGGEILGKLGPIDNVGFGAGDLIVDIARILVLL